MGTADHTERKARSPERIRVVVVGHGMVGSRFVADLLDRDPGGRFDVTVLGAEEYEPYNRVLLSDLVAGTVTMGSLILPTVTRPDRRPVTVVRGTRAVGLDRAGRTVRASDGAPMPYDLLVLATGARARVPQIAGLPDADAGGETEAPPRGVHVLRSLDDAREIVAGTLNARSAAVLGGGVLGLEVAAGLARRGVPTTVVHAAPALMERQLDGEASDAVTERLTGLGICTELNADTREVLTDADGRVTGLRLADGRDVAADLLVLSCGTIPNVDLARSAGLPVGRGVTVGPDLASVADARVFAIGDCASPPEGGRGLIAQGWDQARRLAAHLSARAIDSACCGTGQPLGAPQADPSTDVVRVKGAGLDIVTMGASGDRVREPGNRVLRLSDPDAGRLVQVVVRDRRLVGATCVGAGQVAADLTIAYTRGSPVPADPAHLLLRPVGPGQAVATSPTNMPSSMTVCRCNGVTKGDIVTCFLAGGRSASDVAARTRATTGCGGCAEVVDGLLDWLHSSDSDARDEATSQPAPHEREHDVRDRKHEPNQRETARA